MAEATEMLEHMEHAAHAGHEHGHGDPHKPDRLGTYVGITMASLGVLLAFCSAKVGGERTELVKALVEQQHAHAKYQTQDLKHRVAVNNLRQLHATIPAAGSDALDADLKKVEDDALAGAPKVDGFPSSTAVSIKAARAVGRSVMQQLIPGKADAIFLADTVDRYLKESEAAGVWVEAFNPAINAHVEASEKYEVAQLFAEIGIVVASVALLMKRRAAWYLAIVLGLASIGYVATTYASTGKEIREADEKIEETGKEYRATRSGDKMGETDQALVDDIRTWAGQKVEKHAEKKPEHGGAKAGEHGGEKAAEHGGEKGEK